MKRKKRLNKLDKHYLLLWDSTSPNAHLSKLYDPGYHFRNLQYLKWNAKMIRYYNKTGKVGCNHDSKG